MENVYHLILGAFALVGAALWGKFILSKKRNWIAAAVGLSIAATGLLSGWMLLTNRPTEMRFLTELMGTAGAVFVAFKIVTAKGNKKNPWVQYGIPLAIIVFLGVTWQEQIGKMVSGQYSLPAAASSAAPASNASSAPGPTKKECDELPEMFRKDFGCKN